MNQKAHTTEDTNLGTSTSLEKKRGRPPKTEETGVTYQNLDAMVTSALNSGKKTLLVSSEVLKSVLRERYKNDAYMMYRNIELHDAEKYEATMSVSKMTTGQKVFGQSKVKIVDNRQPSGQTK
jgi:hypothetical protein